MAIARQPTALRSSWIVSTPVRRASFWNSSSVPTEPAVPKTKEDDETRPWTHLLVNVDVGKLDRVCIWGFDLLDARDTRATADLTFKAGDGKEVTLKYSSKTLHELAAAVKNDLTKRKF